MSLPKPLAALTARPYWWMYTAGVLLLVISAWLWWTKVYLGPERVFWGMVSNSLSTSGVTVEFAQESEQNKIRQIVQVELGAADRAHSLSTLTQGNTEIKTEIIGTRDADYTRYRSIKTDQKNEAGQSLDVSKVVNVWSKSDDIAQSETQASGHQLFAQALLGIGLPVGSVPVPIGEVSAKDRDKLLRQIREQGVYEISFNDVKKERKDGRSVYTYDIEIQTILYVRLMKDFARKLGLHELDQVDPNAYQTAQPLKVTLTVDPYVRRLVAVSNGQEGFTQTYHGYGLPLKTTLPKDPISAADLQRRLTEL